MLSGRRRWRHILWPYNDDGQRLRCYTVGPTRWSGPVHADGTEHIWHDGCRMADRAHLRQPGLQSGIPRSVGRVHCGESWPLALDLKVVGRIMTDPWTERLRLLQPHQASPSRSHSVFSCKPATGLLRREDWQRRWLPKVAQGPESLQPQDWQVPRRQGSVEYILVESPMMVANSIYTHFLFFCKV
jgi:hypothetical protein